jgi:hypothetical protein
MTKEELDKKKQKIHDDIVADTKATMEANGLTADVFVKRLKAELNAKETKIIKVKKNAGADAVMAEILAATGGKGKKVSGIKVLYETSEEKVLAVNVVAWGIRQNARVDGQKLLDMYPVEKRDLTIRTVDDVIAELDD